LILLDTHVVLWLLSDPVRLSKAAQDAIDDVRRNGSGLAICGITLLEIATANLNGESPWP
jgi:PIN domain nuclease of toxin-antitoxin system